MDEKTSNNQNYLSRGTTVLRGNLVPDADNVYDIGTPSRRIRKIYANVEGEISDPDIAVNNIRLPFIGPHDLRIYRPGNAKTLAIDDNAGGDATLSVGNVVASLVDSTAVQTPALIDLTSITLPNAIEATLDFNHLTLPRMRLGSGGLVLLNGAGLTSNDTVLGVSVGGGSGQIQFNGATLNQIATLQSTTVSTPTVSTTSGNLTLNPAGTGIAMSNKALTGVGTLAVSAASNSAGTVVQVGSTTATTAASDTPVCLDMGSSAANVAGGVSYGDQKLRFYSQSNGNFMGISMNNSGAYIFSFGGPNADAYFWAWVANGTQRMVLTNAGQLQVFNSVQTPAITTGTGDLSLNPAGSNINCNNKTLINANIVRTPVLASTTLTHPHWTGSLVIDTRVLDGQTTFRLRGTVIATASSGTLFSGGNLPVGARPTETSYGNIAWVTNQGATLLLGIVTGGLVFISKVGGAAFAVNERIEFDGNSPYGTYW